MEVTNTMAPPAVLGAVAGDAASDSQLCRQRRRQDDDAARDDWLCCEQRPAVPQGTEVTVVTRGCCNRRPALLQGGGGYGESRPSGLLQAATDCASSDDRPCCKWRPATNSATRRGGGATATADMCCFEQ